ncbi:MAG TPA: MmgE/PrpD family protein [Jatrophihabitans sp.]|nr:MmgE/PrpD family protein [Jatrophihabitans sp.]
MTGTTDPAAAELSDRLAAVVAELTPEQVPEPALEAAAFSLVDAVGVSLAASGLGEGCAAFVDLVRSEGGRAESSVLGFGLRVPAAAAALANGAMAHALDFEDAVDGAAVHPSAQVVPAVLALAEQADADGARTLAAIALGADVSYRLARAAGDRMAERGWYPPPIVGAVGATAAAAFLVGLDRRQTLDALSLVQFQATASGEIKYSPESIIRGVRDAFAASAAVRSVQLAARGVRGFDQPLEGRAGFLAAFTGERVDLRPILTGLGTEFVGPRISFKAWPSCRGTHAFVESALRLRAELAADEVESVRLVGAPVNTMLAEPRAGKLAPTTAIDAKFSVLFTVATALVRGEVTLASFTADALRDPAVLEMARRIEFEADPARDSAAGMTSGRTELRTRSGRTLADEVVSPLGSPAAPLPRTALVDKFVACAAEAATPVPPERARAMADALLSLRHRSGLRGVLGDLFAR